MNVSRPGAALVALIACATLAACGGDEPPAAVPARTTAAAAPTATATDEPIKVYAVGEDADAGVAVVRVTKVLDPKKPPAGSIFQPAKGSRFVSVAFEIQNKGTVPLSFRAGQLRIFDAQDKFYGDYPDPDGFSGETIAAGQTTKGIMIFEVPTAQTALRFHVDPPALDGGRAVEFRLGT